MIDWFRRLLARHRSVYWAIVVGGLAVAVVAASHPLRAVVDERAAWGTEIEVLVATARVDAGVTLAPVVARRSLPRAVVPDLVVQDLPPEATARRSLVAGEILTAADIAAVSGPAALARPGDVVVAVVESVPSGADIGDQVVVVVDGVVLVDRALVVGRRDLVVDLSVPFSSGAVVAAADAPALLLLPE